MYYVIYDLKFERYLTDKKGGLIRCSTIGDCLDYIEYILKDTNFGNYCFFMRTDLC